MTTLARIQRTWLAAMLFFLVLTQLLYDDTASAHNPFPGFVTLGLLILCFPSGVLAYIAGAALLDQLFGPYAPSEPSISRFSLIVWWSVFLAFGAVQWFALPALWRALRPSRHQLTFGLLILTQAAHSAEEVLFRLWESFPPARFISTAISPADPERGFVIGNILLVAFGTWCFFWPVKREWAVAGAIAWLWVIIETINGIVHSLWALHVGRYAPGVATAPILLILALYLARQLVRR